MKKGAIVLLAIFLLNCTSDDSKAINKSELFGAWKLIEQLADPGDGSGTFQSIESDRVVEFFSDGTITANGTLCFTGTENNATSGTFTFASEGEFTKGEIIPNDCISELYKILFEIENSKLILWYPCIEGCGEKFEKML